MPNSETVTLNKINPIPHSQQHHHKKLPSSLLALLPSLPLPTQMYSVSPWAAVHWYSEVLISFGNLVLRFNCLYRQT